MKIPIIQGNEKIPFWREVTKRELHLLLRNTERGAVSSEAVFVKYYPDFKLSLGNLEGKLKFYFIANILYRWRFQ